MVSVVNGRWGFFLGFYFLWDGPSNLFLSHDICFPPLPKPFTPFVLPLYPIPICHTPFLQSSSLQSLSSGPHLLFCLFSPIFSLASFLSLPHSSTFCLSFTINSFLIQCDSNTSWPEEIRVSEQQTSETSDLNLCRRT